MRNECPNCRTVNAPTAICCSSCRAPLPVATVQGTTVIMTMNRRDGSPLPLNPSALADEIRKTLVASGRTTLCRPAHAMQETQREHLIIVMDESYSMDELYSDMVSKLTAACQAAVVLICEKAHEDDQDMVGIAAFCCRGRQVMPLRQLANHRKHMIEALQAMGTKSGTDINSGLKQAEKMFDWATFKVVRRIVLLTDGQGGHPLGTAERLKERGVIIDVVGVGDSPRNVNEKLLKKVASTVQGELRYRFIKDQQTLLDHYTVLGGKTLT